MLQAADAWCWDARPWPDFPARQEVWADAGSWRTGHWLNGRLGGGARNLLAEILLRAGLQEIDFEIGAPDGEVQGYVIDRPMRVRDALEPLLDAIGMIAAERGGRIAVVGNEPAGQVLTSESLALPSQGGGVRADRSLEATPAAARVRFIDGDADYQTGSVVLRGAGEGGGLDMDLPAVCPRSLAQAAAARALEAGREDRLTLMLGPLQSLEIEPGDIVSVLGDGRNWRVLQVNLAEEPRIVLEPLSTVSWGEDNGVPTTGETVDPPGAPFFRMIDLPPLLDGGEDARPFAVVAGDPWRPIRVFAGADAASLTVRGDLAEPATVGQLIEPLARGPRHRWDEVNALEIRVEGRAPQSLATFAVLAGGNAVAVETDQGWEVVQFRTAELIEGDIWKLSGLLQGQQGTEDAMAAGAAMGAPVVFLGVGLERAASPPAERELPLLWRAAPAGTPPGGGSVSEVVFAPTGLHERPWSPAHLRCTPRPDGGFDLTWVARSRLGGDQWDGEVPPVDTARYKVTVRDAGVVIRSFEADATAATYDAVQATEDFPAGPENGEVSVEQWGAGFGWGVEARTSLI